MDPRDLVSGPRLLGGAGDRDAADALLQQVLDATRDAPCGVRALLAAREAVGVPSVERSLRRVDVLAREFCDAGLSGQTLRVTGDGDVALADGAAVRRGEHYAIVTAPVSEAETFPVAAATAADHGCGVDAARAPSGTVRVQEGGLVAVIAPPEVERLVVVRGDGTVVHCGDEDVDPILPPSTEPYRVYALAPTARVDLELADASGGPQVWSPGRAPIELPVQTTNGGYTRAAPSPGGAYCTGYLPDVPTAQVYVSSPGWITISVDTDGDPVLFVRDASGAVQCNDDWDSLQSRVEMEATVGMLQIYVGTFGMGASLSGSVLVE